MLIVSPANVEAATLFKENLKEYERRVKVSYLMQSSVILRRSIAETYRQQ